MLFVEKLGVETEVLADLAMDLARARVAYKKTVAIAYLRAAGPVKERDAKALIEGEEEFEMYEMAEALHSSKQELLRTLRSQMDSLRTIAANIRAVT